MVFRMHLLLIDLIKCTYVALGYLFRIIVDNPFTLPKYVLLYRILAILHFQDLIQLYLVYP